MCISLPLVSHISKSSHTTSRTLASICTSSQLFVFIYQFPLLSVSSSITDLLYHLFLSLHHSVAVYSIYLLTSSVSAVLTSYFKLLCLAVFSPFGAHFGINYFGFVYLVKYHNNNKCAFRDVTENPQSLDHSPWTKNSSKSALA